MKPFSFLLLILLMLPIFSSCAMQTTQTKSRRRNDPLIDKIIATKTHAQIDFETLIKTISSYDVIYLSEKHDNPAHHQIQKKVINALIKRKLYPTIGFEFFAMEDTPDLLNFIDSGNAHHSKEIETAIEMDLRKKLGWDTQPDDMWRYYFDLLKLARDEKLQVAGIDLPSTLKKRITRKGIEGLSPIEREQIFSTHLSNDTYKKYMFSIFKSAHCGMAQSEMQAKLYTTWIARNDKMALSISRLNQYRKGPVVVIIGKGHTEYGLGVIDRVAAIDKTIRQVNIGLTEISNKPSSLGQYLLPLELKGFKKAPPADYLWFTPRVSSVDPCKEFQEMLKKIKKHQHSLVGDKPKSF